MAICFSQHFLALFETDYCSLQEYLDKLEQLVQLQKNDSRDYCSHDFIVFGYLLNRTFKIVEEL